jgi:5-methylcytosine-specific restriction endonuclease McrA
MQKYIRSSVVSISEVLPLIKSPNKRAIIGGESVKVEGVRLKTFQKKGTVCSCCGLKAKYFAVERSIGQETYHLNLYGKKNGKEVLFTHDHTLARALGGKNDMSNTTTMCTECNAKKAVFESEAVKRVRNNEGEKEEIIQGMSEQFNLSIRGIRSALEVSSPQVSA